MGIKGPFKSEFLEKLDQKDRPSGREGWTSEESQKRGGSRQELTEQKTFYNWLLLKNILFYQSRTDKRPTFRKGASDFTIFANGKTLFVEFKAPGFKQSDEQVEFQDDVFRSGHRYAVVFSADEAIKLCRSFFDLV